MSELSVTYSEYERLSNLLRQLNRASRVARRVILGVNPPSDEEQRVGRDQLDDALQKLSPTREFRHEFHRTMTVSLDDVLRQVPDSRQDVSPHDVNAIRQRITAGLSALTSEDLEKIDRITDALDSASEVLFRRIQR
jgi:hypothetical protein